jgi:carbon-monoxide dehydrogenase medium subunit
MWQAETYTPESVDEVAALLLAADGQDYPVVKEATLHTQARLSDGLMPIIVDLARVPELNRVDYDERNGLFIGAAVPLAEPLQFAPVRRAYAILGDGVSPAGSTDWRARATLGECLGNQMLQPDLAVPLSCLGASVAIFGPHGWSEMSVEALCASRTGRSIQPGEFIVGARLPAPEAHSGGAYVRCASAGGAAGTAAVAAFLVMQADRQTCCGARIGVWTEVARFMRALDAERFLHGRRLSESGLAEAGHLAAESVRLPNTPDAAQSTGPIALHAVVQGVIQHALERARTN